MELKEVTSGLYSYAAHTRHSWSWSARKMILICHAIGDSEVINSIQIVRRQNLEAGLEENKMILHRNTCSNQNFQNHQSIDFVHICFFVAVVLYCDTDAGHRSPTSVAFVLGVST